MHADTHIHIHERYDKVRWHTVRQRRRNPDRCVWGQKERKAKREFIFNNSKSNNSETTLFPALTRYVVDTMLKPNEAHV